MTGAGQLVEHMRIAVRRRVTEGGQREQPVPDKRAAMIAQPFVVINADRCREIQVGVTGPDRETASFRQRLEQPELDRRTVGIHERHRHEDDRPGGTPLPCFLVPHPFRGGRRRSQGYGLPPPGLAGVTMARRGPPGCFAGMWAFRSCPRSSSTSLFLGSVITSPRHLPRRTSLLSCPRRPQR